MVDYGPIWQLKENLKGKTLLLRSYYDDLKRTQKLIEQTLKEVDEYETVLNRLGESEKY